jgi:general nucleoside transport system ATP-binding protein
MSTEALVQFLDVQKIYPNGTAALAGVSFSIRAGEIHAICGENGAGKSTLMKILFGLEQPSAGVLRIGGKEASLRSTRDAAMAGIGMVHQHFSLVPSLTVAENISLGFEPTVGGVFFNRRAAHAFAEDLSVRYRLQIDPRATAASLSIAMKQKAEILKALARNVRLLILDEPTAVLTPAEAGELFDHLRQLKAAGVTILFISHKLKEVRAIADHITVLRAGKVSGSAPLCSLADAEVTRLAMGKLVPSVSRHADRAIGAAALQVEAVSRAARRSASRITDITLAVAQGEIVGVAGVDGAGQEGLVEVLTGDAVPDKGRVLLGGEQIGGLPKARLRALGVSHLPADRYKTGGASALSLTENAMALARRSPRLSIGQYLKSKACEVLAREMIEAYDVRCTSPRQPLGSLSGGNAQKLIAAREFSVKPRLLIAEEPTRGIDVLAASTIHSRMVDLARSGTAVLLLTSDLDELLTLSDRIVVMHDGRIVAQFDSSPDLTTEEIGRAMLGLETSHA